MTRGVGHGPQIRPDSNPSSAISWLGDSEQVTYPVCVCLSFLFGTLWIRLSNSQGFVRMN